MFLFIVEGIIMKREKNGRRVVYAMVVRMTLWNKLPCPINMYLSTSYLIPKKRHYVIKTV